jgi:hypothetical protein
MEPLDLRLAAVAARQRNLVARSQVLAAGGTDGHIRVRVARGQWKPVHPGVVAVAPAPLDWHGRLLAATLAAGDGSGASGRAALVVHGLDGLRSAPLEVTVPRSHGPVPADVIVHRSRRPAPLVVRHGIPVTAVERALLDAAGDVPSVVIEKALHSAVRLGLTTPEKTLAFVDSTGARGVKGAARVREVIADFGVGRPARSGGEVVLGRIVRQLRRCGIEAPIRNYELDLADGTKAVVDLAWPGRSVGAEFDGLDAHTALRDIDYDDLRQNAILDLGWELRRFGWRTTSRRPEVVLRTLLPLLLGGSS